jgi:hypothetical protein
MWTTKTVSSVKKRLLPFGVAAVCAVGIRVEELAQGEPVGGFSR